MATFTASPVVFLLILLSKIETNGFPYDRTRQWGSGFAYRPRQSGGSGTLPYDRQRQSVNSGINYLGCFEDNTSRIFKIKAEENRQQTPTSCLSTCEAQGYPLAGLQYMYECYCGNRNQLPRNTARRAGCYTKCPGDNVSACGGVYYMSVYERATDSSQNLMQQNGPRAPIYYGDVQINPAQGYAVYEIGQNVYYIGDGGYLSMFIVTNAGVVLVDCPPSMKDKIPQAIAEKTSLPVTHIIYSHNHKDHIGCSGQFNNVEIIAQQHASRVLTDRKDRNRPVPTRTFTDELNMVIGGKRFQLKFFGPNHTPDNIFIYLPDDKVLFLADVIYPTWTPYYNLGIAEDMAGYLETVNYILEKFDWDVFIGAHLTRAGSRRDIEVSREFINDLLLAGKQAQETQAGPAFGAATQQYPALNQTWARFEMANSMIANECERILQQRWAGRTDIRGVGRDMFLHSNCYAITQAQIIDIGSIGNLAELNTGVGQ